MTADDAAGSPPVAGKVAERTTKDLVRAAVSGWLGTALEFMDFQLYSLAAALVFSKIFFPSDVPGVAVIAAMATYATGYLSRPLGAWYFGRLGDRVGRTKVLFYTIALMGISTTLIGFLPTWLIMRARVWSQGRRLEAMERNRVAALQAERPVEDPEPVI